MCFICCIIKNESICLYVFSFYIKLVLIFNNNFNSNMKYLCFTMKPVKQNENYSYIYRGGIIQIQRRKSKSDRDREKVIKRAHCFQSARTSLSFRPCWIPAIQMTGVRRKGLQRVSPSPSQQLPFMRLDWLWGHLHHNSCHFAHPSSAHSLSETNTYTGTHIQWQTYTHTHTH